MNIKKLILFYLIFSVCVSCSCKKGGSTPGGAASPPVDTVAAANPIYAAKTYKEKAKYVYDLIIKYYSVPETDFLLENYPKKDGDRNVAYMWPYSGMVTGVGMLRQLGYAESSFEKIDRGIDKYWSNKNSLAGVSSYPQVYGGGTRFYDDNATVGLDYLENYAATKNPHFLEQAEKCMAFDFTGESADCDGGVFWNEDERQPVNTNYIKAACSSAFATTLSLKLYEINPKPEYLAFGKRVYDWARTKLQDPADLIYWNDIAIKNCEPNKTKWTYNSGAMLSNAVLLYKITGEKRYLDEARDLAGATYKFFTVQSDKVGRAFPNHDPWFTTVLFRAYLAYYEVDPEKKSEYIDTMIRNVDYAWLKARTPIGFFYEDWNAGQKGRYEWLLHQACMVEMYGRIAIYKGER